MKTFSKIKGIFYDTMVIQDESGLDTIAVRKERVLTSFASYLRQIEAGKTPAKARA
jgi:hypothetical protein